MARIEIANLPKSLKITHKEMSRILGGSTLGFDLSEETALRMQLLVDRRSKTYSTLSNIMKKISSTQDSIIQNLK